MLRLLSMIYQIKKTKRFDKDVALAQKRGKNLDKLFAVIEKLANGEELETKFRDHDLKGQFEGCRECHIEPDWLLIYEIFDDCLVLVLNRTGTHSDLF